MPDQQENCCWVLTEGIPGKDNQSLGIAVRLGMPVIEKLIRPTWPWRLFPPRFWWKPFNRLKPGSAVFEPPWPRVVIGTGRMTVALGLAIKRASGGRTFNLHIHNPHTAYDEFDLIVLPEHDALTGANVVTTIGGLHTITPERIAKAVAQFEPRWMHLPRPWCAVLLGGNNRAYRLTPEVAQHMGRRLAAMCRQRQAGLLVTPSRRTEPAALESLCSALADTPTWVWDRQGDNPYLAFLGLADLFVVTGDSINMISEACATGKPVLVYALPGGSSKFERFHQTMLQRQLVQPFADEWAIWSYSPLNEMAELAQKVLSRL